MPVSVSTLSLKPSPSVSAKFGSVPRVDSVASLKPSPSVSCALSTRVLLLVVRLNPLAPTSSGEPVTLVPRTR